MVNSDHPTQDDPHQKALEALSREDYSAALALLAEAARAGNLEAQYRLGIMYANAEGVSLDYVQAAEWLRRAAEGGHGRAQSILAWLYASGYGVEQNDAEAGRLYLQAAHQGLPKDQYTAAAMYRWGRYGVERDPEQMVAWYVRAAQQNFAPAQFALGQLLTRGELGVERDLMAAFQWLSLAVVNGSDNAGRFLEQLTRQMSPEEVEQAKRQMMDAAGSHSIDPDDAPLSGSGHML